MGCFYVREASLPTFADDDSGRTEKCKTVRSGTVMTEKPIPFFEPSAAILENRQATLR